MKLTFLGTGTSQGVPVIACECAICLSKDSKDNRLRCSVLIESDTTSVVIDTGPDFRQQMLNNKVKKVDALVYTHEHKDHVAGMDDVRAFNFKFKTDMPIYASEQVQVALKNEFHYVFGANRYPGTPKVYLNTIDSESQFTIGDIPFQSIEVLHYKMKVFAYRIKDLVYITDANFISDEQFEKVKGCKTLVINALRKEKHLSHYTLEEALEVGKSVGAERIYLTHISHLMGKHKEVSNDLPKHVQIAYDGLQIEF
jgi:phosphoribosyl 1,2-cyclic phosphate phosphodiesterase